MENIAMSGFDYSIGDIRITRVEEMVGPFVAPTDWFGDYNRDEFESQMHWMAPNYFDVPTGRMVSSVHSWILRVGGKTILVDTCTGNHKERPGWDAFHMLDIPYLERLRAVGIEPEEVDMVMCTHLHLDHVGWNTRLENGTWVPTFPNARYLMSRTEAEFFADYIKHPDTQQVEVNTYNDSVLPIIEAGRHELLTGVEEIAPGLTLCQIPGHTPGHIGIDLNSAGKRALFAGDAFHFPLQISMWRWRGVHDHDPEQACDTRRRILEHCVEHDALLLPAHFPAPHGGYIRDTAGAFSIDLKRSFA
jgi:glyoxylase-like metal-dependent hydrolase (beta-lactamase superfamily II)